MSDSGQTDAKQTDPEQTPAQSTGSSSPDIDLVESVVTKTADVVAGVQPEQAGLPTPCADYDVRALVNHIVGWGQVFAAAANGEQFEGDPTTYSASDLADAAQTFRQSAQSMVTGWRAGGADRKVRITGGEVPAAMALNLTAIEFLTHAWDLATATGQPVPFSDGEAAAVLARAESSLTSDFRGDGKPFGPVVEVPANAPAIDRLAGFMGRRPLVAG
jgi:uncharacterized protein (TIGR03086 family)